ncbi:MAG: hypothetical protein AAB226_03330, partial [candidate division NC10 bacterium]
MTQIIDNAVKRAVKGGRLTAGAWLSLCSPIAAEIMAGAGFDWLRIARYPGRGGPRHGLPGRGRPARALIATPSGGRRGSCVSGDCAIM